MQTTPTTHLDFSAYIAERTQYFTGREWVFQAVNDWLADLSGTRTFLLTGGPGSGKTAVTAWLAQMSLGQVEVARWPCLGKDKLVYFHFCQAQSDATLSPLRFVEAFSAALANRYPPFAEALLKTSHREITVVQSVGTAASGSTVQNVVIHSLQIGNLPARIAFDRVVRAPLEASYAGGFHEPLVIVVDSMDEALTFNPDENLVSLLQRTDDLPKQVRFLLTSRNDKRVKLLLGESSLDLIGDAPDDANDVGEYARLRLAAVAEPQRGVLAARIAKASEGNFLYARYVLDDLLPRIEQIGDLAEFPLPHKLEGVYREFLQRELAAQLERWGSVCPIMGALAVAQGTGLTRAQLAGITGLPPSKTDSFLRICMQYLSGAEPNGPYRIYHQSFRDFMLNDLDFQVYPGEAHAALAHFFADAHSGQWTGCDDAYAILHTPLHLAAAARAESSPHGKRELVAALKTLLLDFAWMQRKLEVSDISSLLLDYDYLSDDTAADLVKDALRLAAHVLAKDPAQLVPQLWGRLVGEDLEEIQGLLQRAKQTRIGFWFRPLRASLPRPGETLLSKLTGHTDYVRSLVLTPDGSMAVSGSGDGTLRVWDLTTPEERYNLQGHTNPVTSLAITPDGRTILSGSIDDSVCVWDLHQGKRRFAFTGHTRTINAVVVTPDGRNGISASEDGTLRVWDLLAGVFLYTLTGHGGPVVAVAVTPDGHKAVSGSKDGTLKVWELPSGRLLHTLGVPGWREGKTITLPDGRTGYYFRDGIVPAVRDKESGQVLRQLVGHIEEVTALALTPDRRRVVSGSRDATLRAWDLETGAEQRILIGHGEYIYDVSLFPNGQRAGSVSADRTARVWDLENGSCLHSFAGHDSDVTCLAFTPDGRGIVTGSRDDTVRVWDLERGEERACLRGHTAEVRKVVVTPDGQKAISASNDKTLRIWDLAAATPATVTSRHLAQVNAVAVTLDGRRAVTASGAQIRARGNDNTLIVWDTVTGEALHTLAGHSDYLWSASITPDGRRVVSGSGDGNLQVWDLERGQLIDTLSGHTETIREVQVTPNGQRVVSASSDHTLIVWDLATGQLLRRLYGHEDWVNRVVVFADSRRAASSSKDGRIKIWDLEEGKELLTLPGHSGQAFALAVHPDGKRLLSGGGDNTVRVWDLQDGRELRVLKGHTSLITAIAITPRGSWAISASGYGDGTLRVWDLENGFATQVLRGHQAYVIAVAVLPGSKHALSTSLDGTIRLWELATGEKLAAFVGESEFRSCGLALQPSTGAMIAVVGEYSGLVHFLHLEGNYEM